MPRSLPESAAPLKVAPDPAPRYGGRMEIPWHANALSMLPFFGVIAFAVIAVVQVKKRSAMRVEDLEEHIIEKVRAAGRVDQIYPDRERPGLVRIEAEGRSYIMTVAEDFEDEPFAGNPAREA